jgi:hypothetical protein
MSFCALTLEHGRGPLHGLLWREVAGLSGGGGVKGLNHRPHLDSTLSWFYSNSFLSGL